MNNTIGKHVLEDWVIDSLFNKCEFAKRYAERNELTKEEIYKTKVRDFEVDSLDNAEFVMDLEERFEICLPDDAMEKIYDMTIEEVTQEVNRLIEEQV